jgi:hypothetical protein
MILHIVVMKICNLLFDDVLQGQLAIWTGIWNQTIFLLMRIKLLIIIVCVHKSDWHILVMFDSICLNACLG